MRLNPLIPNVAWIRNWRRMMVTALFNSACVLAAGCAAVPGATPYDKLYGNQAAAPAAFDQKVASDAIRQLVSLYPPASTRFNLAQPTPDAFGTALVAGLRERGFALMEAQAGIGSTMAADANGAGTGAGGLELRYLLDRPGASDLYRLTLAIGTHRLSRPYMIHNGTPYAAGAWVRKE
jgi:hypothetical protein